MTFFSRFGLSIFSVLVSACANVTPLDRALDIGLTANVPLSAAGVRDVRAEFRTVFKAELEKNHGGQQYGSVDNFVFGPSEPARASNQPVRLTDDSSRLMQKTAVLVIPGILGECVDDQALPFTDGRVRDRSTSYTDAYAEHKADLKVWSVQAVKVRGRGSSAENAAIIGDAIVQSSLDPRVESIFLVAYSKGVPDALEALADLQKRDAVPAKLHALVSVAGIVMGTPIADDNEHLYKSFAGLIPWHACESSGGSEIESLTRRIRTPWLGRAELPSSVATYSIVATASRDHISPGLRGFYDALSRVSPLNDGQVIAADAILPKSSLLAVALSDHWDFVLPLKLNPSFFVRALTSGRDYPRESLFRAIIRFVALDQQDLK